MVSKDLKLRKPVPSICDIETYFDELILDGDHKTDEILIPVVFLHNSVRTIYV